MPLHALACRDVLCNMQFPALPAVLCSLQSVPCLTGTLDRCSAGHPESCRQGGAVARASNEQDLPASGLAPRMSSLPHKFPCTSISIQLSSQ